MRPSNLLCTMVLGVVLAFGTRAEAARYVVESQAYGMRTEAETHLQRVLIETGDARCRVVRRYIRGEGWRYLVALEGVATEKEALALRARFDGVAGAGTVWRLDEDGRAIVAGGGGDVGSDAVAVAAGPAPGDDTTRPAGAGKPAEEKEAAAPDPDPDPGDERSMVEAKHSVEPPGNERKPSSQEKRVVRAQERAAEERLLAAAEAHGGVTGGREVLASASRVLFRYRRALPRASGTLVADHTYVRDGDAVSVDIDVQSGEGVDSRILISRAGRAWVLTDDDVVARDPERTRSVLERFSPESLLSIPLGFAADLSEASAWRGLRLVEDGPRGAVLEHPGGGGAGSGPDGLVRATFDKNHHLVAVDWREGGSLTRLTYSRYRTYAPSLVLPGQVEVQVDGRVVERIELNALEMDPEVDAELLADPG